MEVDMNEIRSTGDVILTRHAARRARQRSIPPLVIDLLIDYGKESRSHGAGRFTFDRRARSQIARDFGPALYRRIEHKLNSFAVLGADGKVRTVGHRLRRFRRR
jgi:hypothetical protein